MPRIQEYRTRVEAPGPVQGRRASADDFTAGGLGGIGQAIAQTGDMMAKRQEQQEVSDLTAKMAETHAKWTVDFKDRVQKGTLEPDKFMEDFDDDLGKLSENVSTFGGSQYLKRAAAQMRGHFTEATAAGASELAAKKAVADYTGSLNSLSSALVNDPSSFEFARQMHEEGINGLVANGGLPAEHADKLKIAGAQDLAKSAVRGWIDLNPEMAREQLRSGKWNGLIDGDVKHQMFGEVEQAIRAKELEKERQRKEQERALEEQRKTTQNDFLGKMTQGALSTKEILNSNLEAFGSGSKKQFLDMLEENTKHGGVRTDPATFIDLFNRIHLPEEDTKKLRDENDLNQYLIARRLSFEDLNRLRGEIQGKKTAEGAIEAELKKGVGDIARGMLTKSNPLMGIRDPIGDEQYQKYMTFFLTEYAAQRKKGKTAVELLSPESPDYLGKHIRSYTRTPQQIIKDMANMASQKEGLAAPAPSPSASPSGTPPKAPEARKPGESAADYLKRIGK